MAGIEKTPKWFNYAGFKGLETINDPSKIEDGATPGGQNTTPNEGDRISIRPLGYEYFGGTPLTTAEVGDGLVASMHTFRKRNGENILMRVLSTSTLGGFIQFYSFLNDRWQTIVSNLFDVPMGFADFNINTDLSSYVYFCNGYQPLSRWNGAHSIFESASNTGTFIGTFTAYASTDDIGTDFGYVAGDVVTVTGGTATVQITNVTNGDISTLTMINNGEGYTAGDHLILAGPPLDRDWETDFK